VSEMSLSGERSETRREPWCPPRQRWQGEKEASGKTRAAMMAFVHREAMMLRVFAWSGSTCRRTAGDSADAEASSRKGVAPGVKGVRSTTPFGSYTA